MTAGNQPSSSDTSGLPYQKRVVNWLMECFSMDICRDVTERNHRFLEESLELVQSTGCTASEAHQLVDYVFNRPVGEPFQEAGGVKVTFSALCYAIDIDEQAAGETELARVWTKIDKIRAKQAAKPKHSPLPQHVDVAQGAPDQRLTEDMTLAHNARKTAIEECARELETSYPDHAWLNAACAAIRALTAVTPSPAQPPRTPLDLSSGELNALATDAFREAAQASTKPAAWFTGNAEDGFDQVAKEFEGTKGTIPLYATDAQTAFNLGFRAAGGGCHLPPDAERLFQSWSAVTPSPGAGAWTTDQFWEYVGAMAGEFEADQMRDMLAAKGLSISSTQREGGK